MGLLNKLFGGFQNNQNEQDPYFLDDDYNADNGYESEEEESEYREKNSFFSKKQSGNSTADKISNIFYGRKSDSNDTDMQNVVSVKPNSLSDFEDVCECLLNDTAVILNMEDMNRGECQRMTDFTYGVIRGIGGNIQKISNDILIASPNSVNITGDFVGDLRNEITQPQGFSSPISGYNRSSLRSNSFTFNS